MGVVKNLKALSEIPKDRRTNDVNSTIVQVSEYLLRHRIYKKSHDPTRIANTKWTKACFPLMGNIDFLEILLLLSKSGYKDKRMQDAVGLLKIKQNENGRWLLEESFNGRMQVNIERKGKESKWITLRALIALKYYFG